MNQARVIYHLARADFLERVRRYSFLIMLGLVVLLGYQAAIGNIYVQVGDYRGEFNSAWVGESNGERYLEHMGGGPGFATSMRLHPGLELGIVILTNGTDLDRTGLADMLASIDW
jgi:hypothetical protein